MIKIRWHPDSLRSSRTQILAPGWNDHFLPVEALRLRMHRRTKQKQIYKYCRNNKIKMTPEELMKPVFYEALSPYSEHTQQAQDRSFLPGWGVATGAPLFTLLTSRRNPTESKEIIHEKST